MRRALVVPLTAFAGELLVVLAAIAVDLRVGAIALGIVLIVEAREAAR